MWHTKGKLSPTWHRLSGGMEENTWLQGNGAAPAWAWELGKESVPSAETWQKQSSCPHGLQGAPDQQHPRCVSILMLHKDKDAT